jgi:polysaccharide pyruvyl transferase WcaK-like protein
MITAQVADPACSLDKIYPVKRNSLIRKGVIGLNCVREQLFVEYGVPFHKTQMLKLWSRLFNRVVQSGYDCKLFCNGSPFDEQFCFDLLEYMSIPKENWKSVMERRPQSAGELANVIMSFDAIIACRLHASIIAYSYGIPGVALVWNNKQVMFGKIIGYPERFITKEQFNAQYIVNILENAIKQGYNEKNREQYCKTTSIAIDDFVKNIL